MKRLPAKICWLNDIQMDQAARNGNQAYKIWSEEGDRN